MKTVGIETRATIPSSKLTEFEEELFSLGFNGNLTSGIGILENGIIVRSQQQENSITSLEFSYPPLDEAELDRMEKNICSQYSVFFHLIKKYGGNPYPWYLNFRKEPWKLSDGYPDDVKILRGVAITSFNPLHLTVNEDYVDYRILSLFSLGEVVFNNSLHGPFLKVINQSQLPKEKVDLRIFARNYSIKEEIIFRVRVEIDNRDSNLEHFATTALPQDILHYFNITNKIADLRDIYYLTNLSLLLNNLEINEVTSKIKKILDESEIGYRIPFYEVLSNSKKLKEIARRYIQKIWGIEGENPLTKAYSIFLSEIDYVDRVVPKVKKRLYEVTNFSLVKYEKNWLSQLVKNHEIDIHHKLLISDNEDNAIVNYLIEPQ